MYYLGGFRAPRASPYVIDSHDLDFYTSADKDTGFAKSRLAPWTSVFSALAFTMKNFDNSESLTDILYEQVTLFCKFGINQRTSKNAIIRDLLRRQRLETAVDVVNKTILNQKP